MGFEFKCLVDEPPLYPSLSFFRIQISANCCSKSCHPILNLNQNLKDSIGRQVRSKSHPCLKIQKKTSLSSHLLVSYLPSNIVGVISTVMRPSTHSSYYSVLKRGTLQTSALPKETYGLEWLRYSRPSVIGHVRYSNGKCVR